MATDTSLLMGEVVEDPEKQGRNVEQLLVSFLRSLIEEQNFSNPPPRPPEVK
jgi:hypothetical protein